MYYKTDVLKLFAKFRRKHLCWSLFNNVREACNSIGKETLAQVFFCELYEIFKKNLFREHLKAIAFGKNAKNN